ncbi:MAG: DUF4349 domain-containing protein [Coriobacteriia bacterium]
MERHRTRESTLLAGLVLLAAALALGGCSYVRRDAATLTKSPSKYVATQEGVVAGAPEPAQAPAAHGTYSYGVSASEVGHAADAYFAVSPGQRLVVRSKTVRLQVKRVPATVARLRILATRAGGYVTEVRLASDGQPVYRESSVPVPDASGAGPLAGYITVRVPVARYDAFVSSASALGKLLSESESTDDVTQQHVDLAARLRNLRVEEARLRALFARATTVRDTLAVESELARVQGEVESMAAQVTFLERQAAMATVSIELAEPEPVVRPSGTDWGFVAAVRDALRAAVATVNALIIFVGAMAPVVLLATIVLVPVFRHRRRRRAIAEPKNEGPPAE